MSCDCIHRVSKEIDDKLDTQLHKLSKYGIGEIENGQFINVSHVSREGEVMLKGVMLYERVYVPLKKDGNVSTQRKTARYNIIFSFCPFCGNQMDPEDQ